LGGRRSRLIPLAVLLAIALGVAAWVGQGKRVDTVSAVRGDISQTVVSTGRVITPARVRVGPMLTGTVAEVRVAEGAKVAAGEVLARLRDEEQRAAVAQAEATLREAEQRLTQIERVAGPRAEQSLQEAESNLALALDEFERAKRLADANYSGKSQLDQARHALNAARAARERALLDADAQRTGGVDRALARTRLDQAVAALAVARARLDNTVIAAPSAGTVLRKDVEAGDIVSQGKALFELAMAGETQLVLQVDEKNIGLLAIGQTAVGLADAYPNRPFTALLFYIAPGVDAQRGSIEVKLRVPEPPPFLKPDMTVSAEIEVGRRSGAVVVPSEVVREAASPAPWVMVARDGHAARQPVRLGLRGTGSTEVVDGLQPGEAVIPPSTGVAAGQRIVVGAR
jgi:HlyD family secretion protein